MCIGTETAIMLALAAAGTAVQMDAQNQAIRRQRNEQDAAAAEQDGFRSKNTDLLMGAAQQYDATGREQDLTARQAVAGDKLSNAVESTQMAQLGPGAAANGTVSKEFTALQGQRLMEGLKKAASTARLMGNLSGFNNLKQAEAARMADAASEQGINSATARSQWEAAQPRIANAGMVNQGKMLLGSLLQAGSMAYGGAGAGMFGGTVGSGISATSGAQGFRASSSGMGMRAPTGMRLYPAG